MLPDEPPRPASFRKPEIQSNLAAAAWNISAPNCGLALPPRPSNSRGRCCTPAGSPITSVIRNIDASDMENQSSLDWLSVRKLVPDTVIPLSVIPLSTSMLYQMPFPTEILNKIPLSCCTRFRYTLFRYSRFLFSVIPDSYSHVIPVSVMLLSVVPNSTYVL